MKTLLSLCAALLLTFGAATAFAATDVTGAWTGKMVGPNGDDFQITFTFKQDGNKLTGTVGGPMGDPMEITEGKVDGDKLSFNVSFNGMTIKHEGVVTGETIKLTTKAEGGDFPGGEMTLTRNKQAASQQPYKIIDQWKIGGEGFWDYLLADPSAHRLYLTRGARVDVVDTQSGKLIGSISGLHGTHGVALDTAGKFGYISDGGGSAVVVFDRATLATVATIPAGTNPDGIVFEPATQTVWAFNGRSKDVTVIDAATRKVVATIPLPGKPEFPAVDGKGIVFDNIEDKSEIVRLDAHTLKLTAEWPLTGCEGPSGLAFDVAGARLFPVCGGKKMGVIDANTGKTLATAEIGNGPDAAGWDAAHKLAFASCGEGVLSVIDAAAPGYPTIETLPTQASARTMAYDSAADRIYLSAAELGPRPTPTADNPRPRPTIVPGSFTILVVGR